MCEAEPSRYADKFLHLVQTAPLDLDTPGFYASRQVRDIRLASSVVRGQRSAAAPTPPCMRHACRTRLAGPALQDAVEACLARVAAGEAPRLLRIAWEQHHGTLTRGVNWERHRLEELQLVAECIGGPQLAAVCRLLAKDHAGWSGGCWQGTCVSGRDRRARHCWPWSWQWLRQLAIAVAISAGQMVIGAGQSSQKVSLHGNVSDDAASCAVAPLHSAGGMPDLLLWRPAQRDAKLAEVKGPRDRLSMQQTAWMTALEGAGLCAEVLKVVEPQTGGNGGKKRKR